MKNITFTLHSQVQELPKTWDTIACNNTFLQSNYLSVLEKSAPQNMQCYYIAVYENNLHIGVVIAQYLQMQNLESFGERHHCFRTIARNFILRHFASNLLFIGNNMITGQNAYTFNKPLDTAVISALLKECTHTLISHLKSKKIKVHIVTFKDFYEQASSELKKHHFKNYFEFNVQPNMIFELPTSFKTSEDYINALSKKYRDQYKRAKKKFDSILTKELSLDEILTHENTINNLYRYVAKNATFNTFFLNNHHFSTFKKQCGNRFKVIGHFLNGSLVGFHTLLLNNTILETYFLGYDHRLQKEKMLYLNMLYKITEYGIENNFKKIIFGRTALEIKSSVGAKPVVMSGFIYHTNPFINYFIAPIFNRLEPRVYWQVRHPFKNEG